MSILRIEVFGTNYTLQYVQNRRPFHTCVSMQGMDKELLISSPTLSGVCGSVWEFSIGGQLIPPAETTPVKHETNGCQCPLKIHQFLAFQQFFSLTDEASESQVFFEERQNLRNVVSETLVKNRGYFSTNLCKSWWKWQEICQSGNNVHERCGCQENKTPDTETSKKVPQKISQDV